MDVIRRNVAFVIIAEMIDLCPEIAYSRRRLETKSLTGQARRGLLGE